MVWAGDVYGIFSMQRGKEPRLHHSGDYGSRKRKGNRIFPKQVGYTDKTIAKTTEDFLRLTEIYAKYGYVLDCNKSYAFDGLNAMDRMNDVVAKIRSVKVESFGIYKVVATRDYAAGVRKLTSGGEEAIGIPKNNAVYFEIENGSFVCIRPSGTEPKLKVYYSIRAQKRELAEKSLSVITEAFGALLEKVQNS